MMAIVNITDNSFVRSDRMGELSFDELASVIGEMLDAGADVIDIGACSTAPGNPVATQEQEWSRLESILPPLFESFRNAVFSLDTFRPGIAAKACDIASDILHDSHEQFIINDVSSSMPELAVEKSVRYIAMADTAYPCDFFRKFAARARSCGLEDWILDPGFGFGKTIGQNWDILRNLSVLKEFGRPVLVSLSRKRMIYQPLGLTPDTCAEESAAAERLAVENGASIIRTHDLILHTRR